MSFDPIKTGQRMMDDTQAKALLAFNRCDAYGVEGYVSRDGAALQFRAYPLVRGGYRFAWHSEQQGTWYQIHKSKVLAIMAVDVFAAHVGKEKLK